MRQAAHSTNLLSAQPRILRGKSKDREDRPKSPAGQAFQPDRSAPCVTLSSPAADIRSALTVGETVLCRLDSCLELRPGQAGKPDVRGIASRRSRKAANRQAATRSAVVPGF